MICTHPESPTLRPARVTSDFAQHVLTTLVSLRKEWRERKYYMRVRNTVRGGEDNKKLWEGESEKGGSLKREIKQVRTR